MSALGGRELTLSTQSRHRPDRIGARKRTLVLSSGGWPLWDLERTFLWRSIPSYTALYQPGPPPARESADDPLRTSGKPNSSPESGRLEDRPGLSLTSSSLLQTRHRESAVAADSGTAEGSVSGPVFPVNLHEVAALKVQ